MSMPPENINKDIINIICHCRTEPSIKTIHYNWTITHFSSIEKSIEKLQSFPIEDLNFDIELTMKEYNDKKEIVFSSDNVRESTIIFHSYRAYIQTLSQEEALATDWTKTCIRHPISLYNVNLETLYSKSNEFIPNDVLTVCFQFEIFESISNKVLTGVLKTFHTSTKDILPIDDRNNEFITFVTETDTKERPLLRVNKHLLCLKSKYFEEMFFSNSQESITNKVIIQEVKYNIWKHVISYVETGGLSSLKVHTNSINILYDILAVANQYKMVDLMMICQNHLMQCTTKRNVLTHLETAILHNGKYLATFALKFIKLHLNEIINSKDYVLLLQKHPTLIAHIGEDMALPTSDSSRFDCSTSESKPVFSPYSTPKSYSQCKSKSPSLKLSQFSLQI